MPHLSSRAGSGLLTFPYLASTRDRCLLLIAYHLPGKDNAIKSIL